MFVLVGPFFTPFYCPNSLLLQRKTISMPEELKKLIVRIKGPQQSSR